MSKKILCLPGVATNKEFNDFQLRHFKKYFPEYKFLSIDPLVQIDKNRIINNPELLMHIGDKNIYSWLPYKVPNLNEEADIASEYLVDFINKNGPFEGILGFSQGTRLLHYFLGMNFHKKILFEPKFFIFVCPVMNYGKFAEMPDLKLLDVITIHLLGIYDEYFSGGLFMTFKYLNPFILCFEEGHKFPKLDQKTIDLIKKNLHRKNIYENQKRTLGKF